MIALRFTVIFITVLAATLSLYLATLGIRKNRWVFVASALLPLLGAAHYARMDQEIDRNAERMAYAESAFQTLYRPEAFFMEKLGKENGKTLFRIATENGVYHVSFKDEEVRTFHVDAESGENLRGRKNVFDTLTMTNLLKEGSSVVYEDANVYYLYDADQENTIILQEHVVDRIINQEGVVIHSASPSESEPDGRSESVERKKQDADE